MLIETSQEILDANLRFAQIEITGHCNFRCGHCRAKYLDKSNMHLEDIEKIFKFISDNKDIEFVLGISGGEPFLHPKLFDILLLAKQYDLNRIIITTNGSLVTDEWLDKLNALEISSLRIQFSLDSCDENKHDEFRGAMGSFKMVLDLIKRIKNYANLSATIRTTIMPDTFKEVEKITELVYNAGAIEVSFSFVKPVGEAKSKELVITSQQRKELIERINFLNKVYLGKMIVTSSDPLQILCKPIVKSEEKTKSGDKIILGGCMAGITTFNVNVNGEITPCSLMNAVICNIKECNNSDDIYNKYVNSEVVKNLADRKIGGKCGKCEFSNTCGGCRVMSECLNGDYLGEDYLCWK
ncbi:MAG: radical SAM protein [Firmicutes bacterium]|nr:radical SAM protein [Bacillota bacterium]